METHQAIYGYTQSQTQQSDSQPQEADHPKSRLILKNKELNISLHSKYIEVNDGVLSQIYGIAQINELYIHKDMRLSISDCYAISKYIKIFFIDGYGNIVAKYKRSKRL